VKLAASSPVKEYERETAAEILPGKTAANTEAKISGKLEIPKQKYHDSCKYRSRNIRTANTDAKISRQLEIPKQKYEDSFKYPNTEGKLKCGATALLSDV
jgi:hypothetical protein